MGVRRREERQVGREVVLDYKFAKTGDREAATTIFILLANGSLGKWIRMNLGDDSDLEIEVSFKIHWQNFCSDFVVGSFLSKECSLR